MIVLHAGQRFVWEVSTDDSPMADERTAPIFFFAPFVSSTMQVEPAWIDYNGHMNMAYYHVLFDRAVEEAFRLVGLGQDYLEERRPRSSSPRSTPSTSASSRRASRSG